MKKILLMLLVLPMIGFGQLTYVPDDNFENYLEKNFMGNGIANDNYVTTANIKTVTYLNIHSEGIADLTGIEDFKNLENLLCPGNKLTYLDVSNNTALTSLYCNHNQITSLDLSNNTALTTLKCGNNNLKTLDLRNGKKAVFHYMCENNPKLSCINVYDVEWAIEKESNWIKDPGTSFSEECP